MSWWEWTLLAPLRSLHMGTPASKTMSTISLDICIHMEMMSFWHLITTYGSIPSLAELPKWHQVLFSRIMPIRPYYRHPCYRMAALSLEFLATLLQLLSDQLRQLLHTAYISWYYAAPWCVHFWAFLCLLWPPMWCRSWTFQTDGLAVMTWLLVVRLWDWKSHQNMKFGQNICKCNKPLHLLSSRLQNIVGFVLSCHYYLSFSN